MWMGVVLKTDEFNDYGICQPRLLKLYWEIFKLVKLFPDLKHHKIVYFCTV